MNMLNLGKEFATTLLTSTTDPLARFERLDGRLMNTVEWLTEEADRIGGEWGAGVRLVVASVFIDPTPTISMPVRGR